MAFRRGSRRLPQQASEDRPAHAHTNHPRSAHEDGFLPSPAVIGPNEPAFSLARDRVPGPAGATHVRHTAEGNVEAGM